jgi:hypothetical protein
MPRSSITTMASVAVSTTARSRASPAAASAALSRIAMSARRMASRRLSNSATGAAPVSGTGTTPPLAATASACRVSARTGRRMRRPSHAAAKRAMRKVVAPPAPSASIGCRQLAS